MRSIQQKSGFILLLLMLTFSTTVFPANDAIPPKPNPPRLVNDFTGTLSTTEINRLDQKLVRFNDTTSTQIMVVLVNSLNGYDKAQYADLLGEKWGVGHKGKNNGIVVLIKPKRGNEKGEAFIATGYGLEGAVPDAVAKRIVEEEMIPYFKQNRYYEGIDQGTNTLMSLTAGEFTADEYLKKSANGDATGVIVFIVMIVIFIAIVRRNRRNMQHYGGRRGSSMPFWTGVFLGSQMGHGGSWGDFSSGGGSFGGGSSFGGFGGGSFGGGGAGGSW